MIAHVRHAKEKTLTALAVERDGISSQVKILARKSFAKMENSLKA